MSRDDSNECDDIYDFDYLKADNPSWDQVRPKAKPKVKKDKGVKLPPVLVGRNIVAEAGAARMATIMANRRDPYGLDATRDDAEKDWHKERLKLKGPRQPQKEVYNDKRSSLNQNPGFIKVKLPEIPQRIPKYKEILNEGRRTEAVDYGTSTTIDGQPQFPEDKTRKALLLTHNAVNIIERNRSRPSVFDKDYLTKEEKAAAANIDIDKELEKLASLKVPKPPSAPKPVDNPGFSRARRRVRYKGNVEEVEVPFNLHEDMERKFGLDKLPKPPRDIPNRTPLPPLSDSPLPQRRRSDRFVENTELNHAVSVHNDPKPYYKARPNTPLCIDYEKEVNEAVIAQKKFDEINLALKSNQANGFNVDEYRSTLDAILESPEGSPIDTRAMTAALMHKNEAGCSTPNVPILPPLLPQLRAEPMAHWNGDVSRRGVGFKTKLIKEETPKKDINANLPEKIRRQMGRYFH